MTTTATAWLANNASNFKQQDLIQLKIRVEQMDESKAAALLIDEFRSGKLGRITLELPDHYRREKDV